MDEIETSAMLLGYTVGTVRTDPDGRRVVQITGHGAAVQMYDDDLAAWAHLRDSHHDRVAAPPIPKEEP